ncbi:MAG: porin [Mariniblastus sp.]|jgi:porin
MALSKYGFQRPILSGIRTISASMLLVGISFGWICNFAGAQIDVSMNDLGQQGPSSPTVSTIPTQENDNFETYDLSGQGQSQSMAEAMTLRESIADNGITLQGNVTQFYFGNTTGGLEQEFRYGGHGDYLLNFDFDKLADKQGLFLKIRAEHRFGESVSGITGSLLPPNLAADLPTDNENVYITNFVVTQALSETFVLFAGKLDSLDGDMNEFASGRGIRQFSNTAFIASPIALRTVPYSTLGTGFAILNEGEPLFTFLALNPTDTTRTTGIGDWYAEGVTLSSELRLKTNLFGKPGHQLFGGTWSNREFASLGQDPRVILPNVPIATQDSSWSLYWNCDQYLVHDSQNPKKGWGYFARAGLADNSTNPLSYFLSAGLGGTSPLCGRSNDSFGVGYYYNGTSNEIGPLLNAALGNVGDGHGGEMFYNFAVSKSLTITPDIQYISPARENVDSALLVGLRMNIAF